SQSIEVKPQYGLTDLEVEQMLLDSIMHAKEDIQVRALVEAQTEAKQILDATRQFITKNSSLLQEEELVRTETAMQQLQGLIEKGNKDEIHESIEQLNEISRPYAERVMDQAISTAMKGKNIME
ncbi:MAG TPA: Hsp70 family protein, partial [Chitinophagaceae bacterium]|nr:Hsp70 family protein [Chitinophagaceae bacterium]